MLRAGRLRRFDSNREPAKKSALAVFEFSNGQLMFTEAGTNRRASLHFLQGESALQVLGPGGLEVLESDLPTFAARLNSERHTFQRIVYAETETNCCAHCQTGGKILADRALSRLLNWSWPTSLEL